MLYITPTRINALLRCPRYFYFSEVLKRGGEYRSEAAALGTAFHEVIEVGLKGGVMELELLPAAERNKLSPPSREELFNMYPNAEAFVGKVESLKTLEFKAVEEEFPVVELDLKAHPDLVLGLKGGHALIVDHKTTKMNLTEDFVPEDYRRQLYLYAYAVAVNLTEFKTFTLAIHHARSGKVIKPVKLASREDIMQRGKAILKQAEEELQRQEGRWEARPSWLCRFCQHRSLCGEGE